MDSYTTAKADDDRESLTFERLLATMRSIQRDVLYYVDDKRAPAERDGRKIYFHLPASESMPETVIFHPDNWHEFIEFARSLDRPVKHFREYTPVLCSVPVVLERGEL